MSYNGEGNGNPLEYSCLENPVDRGAWRVAVHGVAKSQTRLSNETHTYSAYKLNITALCNYKFGNNYKLK